MGRSVTRWKKMTSIYAGALNIGANAAAYIQFPVAVDRVLAWLETGDATINWLANDASTPTAAARPAGAASPGTVQSGKGMRLFAVGEAQVLEMPQGHGFWHFYNNTGGAIVLHLEAGVSACVSE